MNFNDASANGNPINNTMWSYDPLTMVANGGSVKATPSSLNPTGSGFSVTWQHS